MFCIGSSREVVVGTQRPKHKMAAEWTPPEPALMGEEEFAEFRKDCLDDEGWVESLKTSKLVAYKKSIKGSSVNLVKVKTTFKDIPPTVLYDIFHDHAYRKTWDLNMIDGHVIEMLSANNEIGYYAASVCDFFDFFFFVLLFFVLFFLCFLFCFSFVLFLFFFSFFLPFSYPSPSHRPPVSLTVISSTSVPGREGPITASG